MGLPVDKQRRCRRDAGADARAEVLRDPRDDVIGAPIGLEAVEVDAEVTAALPQVRRVQVPLVGEQRVVHLPKPALKRRRLGSACQYLGARVLRDDREVAEDAPDRQVREQAVRLGAVGALVVAVLDDDDVSLAADVVIRARRRYGGAAEGPAQAAAACCSSASKIRFAPGISSGVGDWCDQSTFRSGPTITSARWLCPRSSM